MITKGTRIAAMVLALLLAFGLVMAEEKKESSKAAITVSEKVGDMEFDYSLPHGLQLSVFGTPIFYSSSLSFVTPGWVEQIYVTTGEKITAKDVEITELENGKKITIKHSSSYNVDSKFCCL